MDASATPKATPTPAPTAKPSTTTSSGAALATFSGSGPGRTSAFTLEPGNYIFRVTHSGSGDFKAWLLNDRRQKMLTIMIRSGSFTADSPLYTPNGGTRYLEVEEGGPWSITLVRD